eukprot:356269-Chlamydomonas_euryale.AAC.3
MPSCRLAQSHRKRQIGHCKLRLRAAAGISVHLLEAAQQQRRRRARPAGCGSGVDARPHQLHTPALRGDVRRLLLLVLLGRTVLGLGSSMAQT